MKITLIRAFVVVLALTGAAASAHSKTTGHSVVTTANATPIPICPPNDPLGCGLD